MKPKLLLGIGIPGSGKTAFLKSFALKHLYTYVCPGDLRQRLTGDITDQTENKSVWKMTDFAIE